MRRNSKAVTTIIDAFTKGYRVDVDGRLISPFVDNRGYLRFNLKGFRSGKSCPLLVHQLAAYQAFGEDSLMVGIQVRHLDGNPLNNCLENIAIGTASQNSMDKLPAVRLRAALIAASHQRSLSDAQVAEARRDYANGARLVDLAKKFGIAKSTASGIVNFKTYKSA